MKVAEIVKRFVRDERGLETVEYAIILGLIVAGTIGLIMGLGGWVKTQFTDVKNDVTNPTETW
jgi:Flp pilus assembly pilin Flp